MNPASQATPGDRPSPASSSAGSPAPLFPRTPLLSGTDVEAKRAELLHYFHATFDRYESLFEVLTCDEAYYRKPISLRHPLIFYFGHTATFFINKF
ncbi:MAG TPA: SAM-dependent methyltransferase, partial [Thauera aminoaromatica]|nr:SAM-dependent methyltransferase [Thauera aminoaromatica]